MGIKLPEEAEVDPKEITKNSLEEEKWVNPKEDLPEAEEEADSIKNMKNMKNLKNMMIIAHIEVDSMKEE
jgi:hypothetical protein